MAVTSLVDSWLLLRNLETNGERNRLIFVRKARGSAHSNQVREFVLTADGPQLLDVYIGAQGVLTGSRQTRAGGGGSPLGQQRIGTWSNGDGGISRCGPRRPTPG